MSETLFTGQPGPKGDKGDRGEGITRGARRAAVFLFILTLALAAANLVFTAHYVNSAVSSTLRASEKAAAAGKKATTAGQQAATATDLAAQAAANSVALCRAGNIARAEQVDLWTFIIRLSKRPRTAQQRQVIAEFEHHLREVFAPRSCTLPRPH